MGIVRVEPLGIDVVTADGETLMAAAERLGYRWPTLCEGRGECGVCYVLVEEGSEALAPVSAAERAVLDNGIRVYDSRLRLACRLRVPERARVLKKGVRAP
jgi:chlorosome envelope protein X